MPLPRFAANLSFLYPELPFPNRFEAAVRDGFVAVEYLFPYALATLELADRLTRNGLQQVLFNAPPAGADLPTAVAAWDAGLRPEPHQVQRDSCEARHLVSSLENGLPWLAGLKIVDRAKFWLHPRQCACFEWLLPSALKIF